MGPASAAHHHSASKKSALMVLRCVRGTRARSRGVIDARVLHACVPRQEGAGKAGCPFAPAASHADEKSIRVSPPQGRRFTPAFPAQWFYGFLRALPGVHDSSVTVTCRSQRVGPSGPTSRTCRFSASQGAPGPHDFAVRADVVRLTTPLRPSHPALNVRDDAQRPSDRGGMGGNSHRIDMKGKRNIFAKRTGPPKSA